MRLFEFIKLQLMLTNDMTLIWRNAETNAPRYVRAEVYDVHVALDKSVPTKEIHWFLFAFKSPAISLANL